MNAQNYSPDPAVEIPKEGITLTKMWLRLTRIDVLSKEKFNDLVNTDNICRIDERLDGVDIRFVDGTVELFQEEFKEFIPFLIGR